MQQFTSVKWARSCLLFGILSITLVTHPIYGQQQGLPPEMVRFEKIATYLTKGTGQWKSPNARYDPGNPHSAEAFVLWFERYMRNHMSLKIVANQKDTTIISSEGFFSWHPGKRQFVHGNRSGGFSEGITEFPNDSTFVSTMTIFTRKGDSYLHKDDNFIVNEDMHRNVSYRKNEEGNWVSESEWTWTRIPQN